MTGDSELPVLGSVEVGVADVDVDVDVVDALPTVGYTDPVDEYHDSVRHLRAVSP